MSFSREFQRGHSEGYQDAIRGFPFPPNTPLTPENMAHLNGYANGRLQAARKHPSIEEREQKLLASYFPKGAPPTMADTTTTAIITIELAINASHHPKPALSFFQQVFDVPLEDATYSVYQAGNGNTVITAPSGQWVEFTPEDYAQIAALISLNSRQEATT